MIDPLKESRKENFNISSEPELLTLKKVDLSSNTKLILFYQLVTVESSAAVIQGKARAIQDYKQDTERNK